MLLRVSSAVRDGARVFVVFGSISGLAAAQSFVDNIASIPGGAPHNSSDSEQVDFGDVDGDGDLDVLTANGGDWGNVQNRIWINQGGAQAGTTGFFGDDTAARFPAVLDASRDIELIDIDADGDLDVQIANDSHQTSRWWINQGGVQGGSAGFYVDDTANRWVNLNSGSTSIWSSLLLVGGGFIDYSNDGEFADFNDDGRPDLLHTSRGWSFDGDGPTRIFLADGAGGFVEFNPSGFRLTSQNIGNGDPGLWCEGTQLHHTVNSTGVNCDIATVAIDSDVADSDGDFDVDILSGDLRFAPRIHHNRVVENAGVLAFRDMTGAAFSAGYYLGMAKYEQEWGDLDNDGDVDIYGLNWNITGLGLPDRTLTNEGGRYTVHQSALAGSEDDEEEADFLDYDQDGDLDVFVANFSGREQLYRNDLVGGVSNLVNVSVVEVPSLDMIAHDVDCADLDGDGDTDAMTANSIGAFARNVYYENVTQIPDVTSPSIPSLEQIANAPPGPAPTVVHAHVFDNQPDYITRFNTTTLEHRVNLGAWSSSPMTHSGGQLFRGELSGSLRGVIEYRVRSIDSSGNVGVSVSKAFATNNLPVVYCTAGVSTSGCSAQMSSSGAPSVSLPSGFTLLASSVEGQRFARFFYGVSGRMAQTFPPSSSSFLCVNAPRQRMTLSHSGGTVGACDGAFAADWLAYLASNPTALGAPFSSGVAVQAQAWFRDPAAPGHSNLSNALEFVTAP